MQTRPRAAEREKANKHANPHNNLRQEPIKFDGLLLAFA